MLSALCYALYKPCRGWRPRQPAPVCLLNPAITPQMAVGANSVRPPLFAYMVCTNSTSRNSSKRDVVFLQSRNCAAPLQVFGQVSAAAKSLCSVLGFTPFLSTTLVSFANSSLLTPHLPPSSLDRFFYLKCTKMLEKYQKICYNIIDYIRMLQQH